MKKIVLTYHRIGNTQYDYNNTCVSKENFEEQMKFIKTNYKILEIREFLKYKKDDLAFLITFDDGYESFIYNVLPVIEKYDIPVTIFVTPADRTNMEFWMSDLMRIIFDGTFKSESIEIPFGKNSLTLSVKGISDRVVAYKFLRRLFRGDYISSKDEFLKILHEQSGIDQMARHDFRTLSIEQVKILSNHRLITIGAHTIGHPSLGYLDELKQRGEIEKSVSLLQNVIDKPIEYFSYPFGREEDYNNTTKRILRENDIVCSFTMQNGLIKEIEDYMAIPRCNCENDSIEQWIYKLKKICGNDACAGEGFFGKKELDQEILKSSRIVVCGCGKRFNEVFTFLKKIGIDNKVIACVDNDESKIGNNVDNIEISKYEKYMCDESIDWIVYNKFDFEIVKQLHDNNIKRIHWWIGWE